MLRAPCSVPCALRLQLRGTGRSRAAKARGWRTVLGQIDPGPPEERIVAELYRQWPEYADQWRPAPREYWDRWREECELADTIMVNSQWSRQALVSEGVPEEKIAVVPLAYEQGAGSTEHGTGNKKNKARSEEQSGLPASCSLLPAFSSSRPMRALFLGQAIVRKGIHDLVRAARSLQKEPVVFDVVGPHGGLPGDLPGNMVFHGPVPRGGGQVVRKGRCLRAADPFRRLRPDAA